MARGIQAASAFVTLRLERGLFKNELRGANAEFHQSMQRMAIAGGQLIAASVAMGGAMLYFANQTSNAIEALNRFKVTSAGVPWTETRDGIIAIADAMGRSRTDALNAAGSFQAMFRGLGISGEQSADMSKRLVQLAIDLASLHNTTDQDMFNRLRQGLAGSAEVLDQFGINLRENALDAQLEKMFGVGIREATEFQKVIARMDLIVQGAISQGAIGDAARTLDDFAGVMKQLHGAFRNFSEDLGGQWTEAIKGYAKTIKDLLLSLTELVEKYPLLAKWTAWTTTTILGIGAALLAAAVAAMATTAAWTALAGASGIASAAYLALSKSIWSVTMALWAATAAAGPWAVALGLIAAGLAAMGVQLVALGALKIATANKELRNMNAILKGTRDETDGVVASLKALGDAVKEAADKSRFYVDRAGNVIEIVPDIEKGEDDLAKLQARIEWVKKEQERLVAAFRQTTAEEDAFRPSSQPGGKPPGWEAEAARERIVEYGEELRRLEQQEKEIEEDRQKRIRKATRGQAQDQFIPTTNLTPRLLRFIEEAARRQKKARDKLRQQRIKDHEEFIKQIQEERKARLDSAKAEVDAAMDRIESAREARKEEEKRIAAIFAARGAWGTSQAGAIQRMGVFGSDALVDDRAEKRKAEIGARAFVQHMEKKFGKKLIDEVTLLRNDLDTLSGFMRSIGLQP